MVDNHTKQRNRLNSHIRNRIHKKFLTSGTTEKYIQYFSFFNETIKDQPNIVFEKHHIIPRFAGGTNSTENLVFLTPRQHVFVHLLRSLEFGQRQDFLAFVLRRATANVDMSSHGKRMAEYHKQNQQLFWDPIFQRKQGEKGGKIGGSANTRSQFEARSKVGKTWGPVVGFSNQSADLKDALSYIMVFFHEKEDLEIVIPPCESAVEVFHYLNNELVELGKEHLFSKELVNKAKKGGSMYNLIRGKKKRIYGWSILERISPTELDDE